MQNYLEIIAISQFRDATCHFQATNYEDELKVFVILHNLIFMPYKYNYFISKPLQNPIRHLKY